MAIIELLEPILSDGIRSTNFFNGRLLSAEDLRLEQVSNRHKRRQLGRALGAGIVEGLDVSLVSNGAGSSTPVVAINAGMAINREGETLSLPARREVALVRERRQFPPEAGLFAACQPPQATPLSTGAGIYLLVLSPASGYEGRAPTSGPGNAGAVRPGCDSRYAVEGLRFGLIKMNLSGIESIATDMRSELETLQRQNDPASQSLLRNLLAHLCFATPERSDFARDPLRRLAGGSSPQLAAGALESLRSLKLLGDCDVPLALVYWTLNGIQFVDNWSVRRRPLPPAVAPAWPLLSGSDTIVRGEAAFLQFQEHVGFLSRSGVPQSELFAMRVDRHFRYLPAAGIIPIGGTSTSRGFDSLEFFSPVTHRDPIYVEGARLETLIRDSLTYPPIDLRSGEVIWLYYVRENVAANDSGSAEQRPRLYMVFSSGHMPYLGDTRHDIARWHYGNYAERFR